MEKSFVIRKSMNLSLKEELVYAVISCNSDENGESHISRKEISNITGIKKHDTITNHTNKLVEEGLITKTYKYVGGKKLVTYKLLSSKKDFMWICNDLVWHYKPEEIGFLVKLAALRWENTDSIHLSNDEIVKRIHVSKTTFYRLIRALLLDGIVTKTSDGYSLSKEIFHTPQAEDKVEAYKAQLDEMAEKDPEFKKDKVYKTFYSHYNTGFEKLKKMSPSAFIDSLESGVFFQKKKSPPVPETKKDYEF